MSTPTPDSAPLPLHLPAAALMAAARAPRTDREQTTEQALCDARPQPHADEHARGLEISDDVRARLFGGQARPARREVDAPSAASTREPAAAGEHVEPADPPRRFIGRFERRGRISFGGMGVVERCFDPLLRREVAIKLRRPDRADREHDYERLLNEARALGALAHDNIVGVLEAGKLDGQLYVVLEYVAGPTLARWLERPRDCAAILEVFAQVGEGLAAAHERNLLHRDVKPANIIVRGDGRVKLIDFGLAKALTSDEPDLDDREPDPAAAPELYELTEHGHVLGTRGFIAPELFFGARPSVASDIFGFCTTLYWALYRRVAFVGGRAHAAARSGARPSRGTTVPGRDEATTPDPPRSLEEALGRYVEPRTGEAGVPRRITRLLRRGLSAHPSDRHASMRELLADLRRQAYVRPLRAGMFAMTVLSAGAAVWTGARPAAALDPCAAAGAELDDVWSDERRAAVTSAFLATGAAHAGASAAAVAAQVDAYAEAWTAARERTCRGASDPAVALQGACLERGEQQLDVTVARLLVADVATVSAAPEQLAALPDPRDCMSRLVADQACHAAIADEPTRALAAQMQRELATARAAAVAGDLSGAIDAAQAAVRSAVASGRKGLIAEARLAHGDALYAGGRPEAARDALLAARDAAQQIACDDVLADAYSRLGKLAALEGGVPAAVARERSATQRNLALSLGPAHPRLADAYNDEGLVLAHLAGRHADAEVAFRRAIDLRAGLAVDDPLQRLALAESHLNWSSAVAHQSDDDEHWARARALLERSIALRAAAVGAGHPSMYKPELVLARRLAERDDFAGAGEHYARALELAAGYGPRSREVARVEIGLADLAYRRMDPAGAREHADRALEIAAQGGLWGFLGPDALATAAEALLADHDLDRAIALLERAALLHDARDEPDARARGYTRAVLADAHYQRGRPQEALRHAARACDDLLAAPRDPDPDLARASLVLGESLLALAEPEGRPFTMTPAAAQRASEALRRGVEFARGRGERELLAWSQWGLARALCQGQGQRDAGREQAERALAFFTAHAEQGDNRQEAAKIRTWLRTTCERA